MDFNQISNFIKAVDAGSFSKAEEVIYISKQALIKQINNLESEVNVPLLIRGKGGITLTEAGKVFYEKGKKLLEEHNQMIMDCQEASGMKATLRLSSVEHQKLLSQVTSEYRKRYPNIEVEFVMHPNHSGEYRVENNIIDIGETFLSPALPLENIQYIPLIKRKYVAVMSKDHPLSHKKQLSYNELKDYPTIYFHWITNEEVVKELKNAFKDHLEHLEERMDVDYQIEITYECIGSEQILVSCNPYLDYMKEVVKIPLVPFHELEYGMITSKKPNYATRKYIELALELFK